MLRKNPAASSASTARSSRELRSVDSEDEKGSKMKRQKESQSKAIVFCLGILAFLGLIAKVEVNHLHRFTGKRLRRHSHHHSMKRQMEEESVKAKSAMEFMPPHSLYSLQVEDIHGKMVNFSMFHGMVTLIVNVACLWGKTQMSYTELAELQKMYSDKGFSVLAFPISDFHQELGSNEEILSFVQENFPQVDFPIFGLSTLDESPVYQSIRKQKPEASGVRWNFYKFLVDQHGQVVEVFDQKVNPLKLTHEIEDLLSKDSDRRRQKLVVS